MTIEQLPSIKEQFTRQYYAPVRQELARFNASREAAFEQAKERYEAQHKHQFPYTYKTFEGFMYDQEK